MKATKINDPRKLSSSSTNNNYILQCNFTGRTSCKNIALHPNSSFIPQDAYEGEQMTREEMASLDYQPRGVDLQV